MTPLTRALVAVVVVGAVVVVLALLVRWKDGGS